MTLSRGLHFGVSEDDYHADKIDDGRLSLSVSVAQALVLESEAHAYLRHPRLGGQPLVPSNGMDRGTLIHKLLLGAGRECAVIECEDWKKPDNRKLRDEHRAEGRLAVTRKLYDASIGGAKVLQEKLSARGYRFSGQSEVTVVWEETADNGGVVLCRGRLDHLDGNEFFEVKVTADANPRTLRKRSHIASMGYDMQGVAYTRGLEATDVRLRGRLVFTILFCEPEPPYCITPVRLSGSLKELGLKRWLRGVNAWERCVRTGEWRDYCDGVVYAEARPWELDEETAADGEENAA